MFDEKLLFWLIGPVGVAVVAIVMAARGNHDAIGYLASLLVLGSFISGSMASLRVFAIMSNLAFIAYALSSHLEPILMLHATLLPVNAWRLIQILRSTENK